MRVLFVIFFVVLTSGAEAQVVKGTPVDFSDTATVSGFNFSVTIPAGTNRALVCFVCQRGSNITTFTYDGVPFTQVTNSPDVSLTSLSMHAYALAAPTVGTANVVLDFESTTTSAGYAIACMPLTGVDQTTPTSAVTEAAGVGESDTTVTTTGSVTSTTNGLVLGVECNNHSSGSGTITGNQTEESEEQNYGGTRSFGMQTTAATGSSVALTWNLTSINASTAWREYVLNVNAAAASGGSGTSRHSGRVY